MQQAMEDKQLSADEVHVKGTGHDFYWSGKPIYHLSLSFSGLENIHIFQNK